MEQILLTAETNQRRAWEIVEKTGIVDIWKSFGAKTNLVGSLKTGLLVKHLDIDFHIYSENFNLADSFAAIARLAENEKIKTIQYSNLLDTDEKCLEWHATYLDDSGDTWQIDMIHILKDSQYAGHFEKVAERIIALLTEETRRAILAIKYEIPPDSTIMGIEVCQAVLRDGIRSYNEFIKWRKQVDYESLMRWMP